MWLRTKYKFTKTEAGHVKLVQPQDNHEIKTKIRIYFYKIILNYKKYSMLNLCSHKKQKYKFAVVYEAGIMAVLASTTKAP